MGAQIDAAAIAANVEGVAHVRVLEWQLEAATQCNPTDDRRTGE